MNSSSVAAGRWLKVSQRGAWMARSVKVLTLGFSSGHDLRDVRSSPESGSAQRGICSPQGSKD